MQLKAIYYIELSIHKVKGFLLELSLCTYSIKQHKLSLTLWVCENCLIYCVKLSHSARSPRVSWGATQWVLLTA